MKFSVKTTEKQFFKYTLDQEWFDKNMDYKKITGFKLSDIMYRHDLDDPDLEEELIDDFAESEYEITDLKIEFEEDDYDRFLKVYCEIKFNLSDHRFDSFSENLKKILKGEGLSVYVDDKHPLEVNLGEMIYPNGDVEIDTHYFYISPAEQEVMF